MFQLSAFGSLNQACSGRGQLFDLLLSKLERWASDLLPNRVGVARTGPLSCDINGEWGSEPAVCPRLNAQALLLEAGVGFPSATREAPPPRPPTS